MSWVRDMVLPQWIDTVFFFENIFQCLFQPMDASKAPLQRFFWELLRPECEGFPSWRSGGTSPYHRRCSVARNHSGACSPTGCFPSLKGSSVGSEHAGLASHTRPKSVGGWGLSLDMLMTTAQARGKVWRHDNQPCYTGPRSSFCRFWVLHDFESLLSTKHTKSKPGMLIYTCNWRNWKAGDHYKFEDSLVHRADPVSKTKQKNPNQTMPNLSGHMSYRDGSGCLLLHNPRLRQ